MALLSAAGLVSVACSTDPQTSESTQDRVGPGPDLVVTAISAPPSAQSGFTARITVCNEGDVSSPSTDVFLYASEDTTLTPGNPPTGDLILGGNWVPFLDVGACTTVDVQGWSVPGDGNAYLAARVDPLGSVVEGSESNNDFVGALMGFGYGPDLVVQSISGPPSAQGNFEARVTVCNQGTADAPSTQVELYASLDEVLVPMPPMGDFMIGSGPLNNLPAGRCAVAVINAWAPPLPNGPAYLAARVDPWDGLSELIESNNEGFGPLMGFGSGPDLIVASVTGPASTQGNFTATVRVCNQGTIDSPGTIVELYATDDEVITSGPPPAGDFMLGSAWVDSTMPGRCRNVSINAWAPPAPDGALYLAAVADPQGMVQELIESNNSRLGALTGFGYGPDLIVTQLSGPPSADGSFTVQATVCNQGTADAPSTSLMLYATADTTVDFGPPPSGDFLIGNGWVDWLVAGRCRAVSISAWTPPGAPAQYLAAVVDENDGVPELIESNNTFLGALTGFGSGQDLVVRGLEAPAAVDGAFTARVTVCNQGTIQSGSGQVYVYSSEDQILDGGPPSPFGDFILGGNSVPSLYPSACTVVEVQGWSPPTQDGNVYLIAQVDADNVLVELIETNNTFVGALMGVGFGPDLIITGITGPASAGGSFTGEVTVCNQGTADASSTMVELYASADRVIDLIGPGAPVDGDFFAGSTSVPFVPRGVCLTLPFTGFAPTFVGGAYLAARVDPFDAVDELIDTNNEAFSGLIGFGYGPDLVVSAIEVPAAIGGGNGFTAQITVCNQGTQSSPGTQVELYGSADRTITVGPGEDFFINSTFVDTTEAGQCRTVSINGWGVPLNGEGFVGAVVDPNYGSNAIVELIESNNTTLSGVVGFGFGPDLVVTALEAPASANGPFVARVTVCNQGTQDAPSAMVELFASTDTTLSTQPMPAGDFFIGSLSTDYLQPGACDVVSINGFPSPQTGAVYLLARLGGPQSVPELIESNNVSAPRLIGMGAGPDLVVTSISGPSSANGSFTTQVMVCNQGTLSSPDVALQVYASTDRRLDTTTPLPYGDAVIGGASTGTLNAGQCRSVAVQSFPPPLTGGAYLAARVDAQGNAVELIESNNEAFGALTGFGFGPDLVVTNIAAPNSVSGSFTAQVTVCNRGTAQGPGTQVELYATADTTLVAQPAPGADFFLGSGPVNALNAGQCQTVAVPAAGPSMMDGAYLAAAVDSFNSVSELIESNNTFLGALIGFGFGPDLVVTALTPDPFVMPGGLLRVAYTVCNRGTQPSTPSDVGFVVATTPNAAIGPNAPTFPMPVAGLAAGACASGSAQLGVPLGEGPGYVVSAADPFGSQPELVERNNRRTAAFSVAFLYCGNGAREATEACDDGNFVSNDGCSATCTIEYRQPWRENVNGTQVTNVAWNYAMGYHFTPNTNGFVTQLGGFFNGTKTVRLFDRQTGAVLAQATVTAANSWGYTTIPAVAVQAGRSYTVAVYLAGSGGSYRSGVQALPRTYGNIRIDGSTYISTAGTAASARPTNLITTTMYGQADIRFSRYQ